MDYYPKNVGNEKPTHISINIKTPPVRTGQGVCFADLSAAVRDTACFKYIFETLLTRVFLSGIIYMLQLEHIYNMK